MSFLKPLSKEIEAMIRVNQAGEYGAKRIYKGQLDVLKKTPAAPLLQHMADQEQKHLDAFNDLCLAYNVRPTFLEPFWHVGGYVLGAATALLGERAAHACTIAVEEVIADHYEEQLNALQSYGSSPEIESLCKTISTFRDEELEHKDHAEKHGGREAPAYQPLTALVKTISKAAIWLSKRI